MDGDKAENTSLSDAIDIVEDVLDKINIKSDDDDTSTYVQERINTLQGLLKRFESNASEYTKKYDPGNVEIQKVVADNRRMDDKLNVVMAEYEKAISTLVREKACLNKERDTLHTHLANAEAAFSDVHKKYERCKEIIETFKANEVVMRDTIQQNEDQILKQNNKYEALKKHAIAEIAKANSEMNELTKNLDDEITKLKATVKKLELQNASLTQALAHKTGECEELAQICDELISKVGR